MEFRLVVEGVPDEQFGVLGPTFPHHLWSTGDGLVSATVFGDEDAVYAAVRHIEESVPGAKVCRVYRDLVTEEQIAMRVGVSSNVTTRWVDKPWFPRPFAVVGLLRMKLWDWSDVAAWMGETYCWTDDCSLPDEATVTRIDAFLAGR